MKYVWDTASGRRTAEAGERIKGFKDQHMKGYGRAVSFSSTEDIIWSSPQPTYAFDRIGFETSTSK